MSDLVVGTSLGAGLPIQNISASDYKVCLLGEIVLTLFQIHKYLLSLPVMA